MNGSKPESLPENKKGFTVNASPLNPVKLELGIILIVGILLLLINGYITDSRTTQFLILGGYGVFAMAWLVVRARSVVKLNGENEHG